MHDVFHTHLCVDVRGQRLVGGEVGVIEHNQLLALVAVLKRLGDGLQQRGLVDHSPTTIAHPVSLVGVCGVTPCHGKSMCVCMRRLERTGMIVSSQQPHVDGISTCSLAQLPG